MPDSVLSQFRSLFPAEPFNPPSRVDHPSGESHLPARAPTAVGLAGQVSIRPRRRPRAKRGLTSREVCLESSQVSPQPPPARRRSSTPELHRSV